LLAEDFFSYGIAPSRISNNDLYYDTDRNPYYGRLIFPEILQTFAFTYVYLVLALDQEMQKLDRMVKAWIMALTYTACLTMTYGSFA